MSKTIFMDAIRSLFGTIDYFIYSGIKLVTQGIFDLSELRVHIDLVNDVRNKVYTLLGIFMLFRLTIAFVSYIIDPEKMTDKTKGASNLILRTVATIALLMILPTGFNFLYRAQKAFLPMLPRILLGTETGDSIENNVENSSENLAISLLQAFYSPYKDKENDYVAIDGAEDIKSVDDFYKTINQSNGAGFLWFGDGYKYEYKFFISTIVGIVALFLLLSITLNVAIRLFKLIILEMIAPIPIIGLITASDGKNVSQGSFASWFKKLMSTFLDIFISLGLVYLILLFIRELSQDQLFIDYGKAESLNGDPARLIYLKVFIIIGLLKFARDIPDFVREIMGIKDRDKGANAIGGFTGLVTGAAGGAAGGLIAGHGLKGARTGAIVGAISGKDAGKSGKDIGFGVGYKAGGETAYQVFTGNPKAKWSGVQLENARLSQAKGVAKKMNITKDTLDMAKENMRKRVQEASDSEYAYRLIEQETAAMKNRVGTENAPTQEQITAQEAKQKEFYNDWQNKEAVASTAKDNYEEAKKLWSDFGLKGSTRDKYYHTAFHKSDSTKEEQNKVKREKRDRVYDAWSTSMGNGKTIQEKREERINRSAKEGGFDPLKPRINYTNEKTINSSTSNLNNEKEVVTSKENMERKEHLNQMKDETNQNINNNKENI